MSRQVLAEELATCAALWPSLNASNPAVLEAFWESLRGFGDAEIRAGFRRVRDTHEGVSFPKPATLIALCGAARNRSNATLERRGPTHYAHGCEIVCVRCGTVTLYHELAADGESLGRLWPWHAASCALRRPDQPTDGQSARIVWPQPRNGDRYVAPQRVQELVQSQTVRMQSAAATQPHPHRRAPRAQERA